MRRRAFLQCAATLAASSWTARQAGALGRTPLGGKLYMVLPWPLDGMDPHDLFDPAAALFAQAVADPLFALDATGEPYPSLVAEPEVSASRTLLRLRPGLVSARGRPLDARDVAFSINRAARAGARALLADLPAPVPSRTDPLAVTFATPDVARVARALSSPLVALVPKTFLPETPDGTGAMRADFRSGKLTLARNPNAARGASFLEEIVVEQAVDLSESLRRFEANETDVSWLGAGLHAPRKGATAFDEGKVAWIALLTGTDAGTWGAPGIAQQLVDAVPPGRIQHLGLGPLPEASGTLAWGGPPCELFFRKDAAQLGELARVLASLFTQAGHEVVARELAGPELARRRASGSYVMMLDVVRPLGPSVLAAGVSLASAVDPRAAAELMRHPPRWSTFSPRSFTRTLRLAVIGEMRIAGAHAPDVRLAAASGPVGSGASGSGASDQGQGWDLSATYRLGRFRAP